MASDRFDYMEVARHERSQVWSAPALTVIEKEQWQTREVLFGSEQEDGSIGVKTNRRLPQIRK